MPLSPEQVAAAAVPGIFQSVVLPLIFSVGWWGLSRVGWIRRWWLRLPVVLVWMLLGGYAKATGHYVGIPGLPDFLLFPLVPPATANEYFHLARRAGMEVSAAHDWGWANGGPVGMAVAVHAFALHWFLWKRSGPRPDGGTLGSAKRTEEARRQEVAEMAKRIENADANADANAAAVASPQAGARAVPREGRTFWAGAAQILLAGLVGAGAMWGYETWREGGNARLQRSPELAQAGEAAGAEPQVSPTVQGVRAVGADIQSVPVSTEDAGDGDARKTPERVLAMAMKYGDAMVRGDYENAVSMMPDFMAKEMGPVKMAWYLRSRAGRSAPAGMTLREVKVTALSPLTQTDYGLAALLPTASVYEMKGGKEVKTLAGYLVGLSEDGGMTWRMLDHHVAEPSNMESFFAPLTKLAKVPLPVPGTEVAEVAEVPPGGGGGERDAREAGALPVVAQETGAAGDKEPTGRPERYDPEVLAALRRTTKDPDAYEFLKRRADAGDPVAQVTIGNVFGGSLEAGVKGGLSEADAARYLRRAAESGHPAAQMQLAWCLEMGHWMKRDRKQAVSWLEKAARQGVPDALWIWSRHLTEGDETTPPDRKAGFEAALKAARGGMPEAQYLVAACYLSGVDVEKDSAQAGYWAKRAAERGHAKAQCMYGGMLHFDAGRAEGLRWIKLAASYGDGLALETLGRHSQLRGRNSPEAKVEACMWWRLAAQQSGGEYGGLRKEMEATMTRRQLEDVARRVREHAFMRLPGDKVEEGKTKVKMQVAQPVARGMGFFVREDGYLITSLRVASAGTRLRVHGLEGTFPATLVESDEASGQALVKVNGAFSAFDLEPERDVTLMELGRRLNGKVPHFTLLLKSGPFQDASASGDKLPATPLFEPVECWTGLDGLGLPLGGGERAEGAPVYSVLGQLHGMVLVPEQGRFPVTRVVRPPALPAPAGRWATDRSWRKVLTIEERMMMSSNASVMVLAYE